MKDKTPKHLVVIPDGNSRWAKEKGLAATAGHVKAGAYENLYPLLDECKNLGIEYVSLWGFSTDNWKRDKKEVNKILNVIEKGLDRMMREAEKEKYKVRHLGKKDRLPKKMSEKLSKIEESTKENKGVCILLCIDYGGRDEIVRAVNKIMKEAGHLGDIKENTFSNYLDTKGVPDPELIIRTGGEKRLSGFMPFQSVYSEIYFIDKYFPDFIRDDLREAVEWFKERKRRFGGD